MEYFRIDLNLLNSQCWVSGSQNAPFLSNIDALCFCVGKPRCLFPTCLPRKETLRAKVYSHFSWLYFLFSASHVSFLCVCQFKCPAFPPCMYFRRFLLICWSTHQGITGQIRKLITCLVLYFCWLSLICLKPHGGTNTTTTITLL